MKIGIVTYWNSYNNYGEQLQNYALQEYLRELGHEPFLIRYDYNNDNIYGSRPLHIRLLRACNPKRLICYFKTKRENAKRTRDNLEHTRGFERFREQHLTMSRVYSSIWDLQSDPPGADMYITGSDQVWNTFEGGLIEMTNRVRAFFLDFGKDDIYRVSYACSWGRYRIPDEEADFVKPLLSRFDAVSVREKSGIDICCRLERDDAVLALDPVLLYGANKYRDLYKDSETEMPKDKYLFFYYMNKDNIYDRKAVFDWAESKGLKVVYVTDDWHNTFERSFPGVVEWLELIDNAEYVVTNSYHCSVISMIFEKRFGVIKRFGAYEGMNTRLDSLFEITGIVPRYIEDDLSILERDADNYSIIRTNGLLTPEKVIEKAYKTEDC